MKNRDFAVGMILSFACDGAATVKREPTAYSYNGVVLPKLPEWDRDVYPYAYIYTLQNDGNYYLEFESSVNTTSKSGGCFVRNTNTAYRLIDDAWEKTSLSNLFTIIWSNTDVYYGGSVEEVGGTLYLAASDPIPVYE